MTRTELRAVGLCGVFVIGVAVWAVVVMTAVAIGRTAGVL